MNKYVIISAIEAQKARSVWARGVKQIALDMLDGIDKNELTSAQDALNGTDSPEQWAFDGNGLIYDADIAALLCTPSALRLTKGGQHQPNSRESWLDVYSRAAYQAYDLIKAICGESKASGGKREQQQQADRWRQYRRRKEDIS